MLDWYRAGVDVQARLPLLSTYLGHVHPGDTYWYSVGRPRAARARRRAARAPPRRSRHDALAPTLQAFFTERLIAQRHASPHTIAAYRDTLRLLLAFAQQRAGKPPSQLDARRPRRRADRRVPRPPRARARQQRAHPQRPPGGDPLAVSLRRAAPPRARRLDRAGARDPTETLRAQTRSPSSPRPRSTRCSPPPTERTWAGRRDHALMLLAVQTGLRVSELTGLRCGDVHLGTGAHVSCPARAASSASPHSPPTTVARLRAWLAERGGQPDDPLFPTQHGGQLSRDALERRLAKHASRPPPASCPSLATEERHPARAATHRRDAPPPRRRRHLGDRALARPRKLETTQIYLHADLALKERALARTTPASDHARPLPAHPTSCSPSSRRSDYADQPAAATPFRTELLADVGITRRSA